MRIDLTPRLRMVGKLIPAGVRLTDVGTDHAYLPAVLIGEGKIPSAIAADLRQGPLARAKETVRQAGLTGKVAFRLCNGLSGIRPDETDAVAIAGMGGETIAAILSAALWTRERGTPLILQPMSSMPELRGWLQKNGFRIEEERLAREGDALYTALLVRPGEMAPLSPAVAAARLSADKPRAERPSAPQAEKKTDAPRRELVPRARQRDRFTDDELSVLAAAAKSALTADEIVERTQIPAKRILSAITMLQVQGAVEERPGRRFYALVELEG